MRNFLHYYAAAIAWVCCSLISPAQAEDIPPSPIVKVAFALHAPSSNAGANVVGTITFTMPEHWHIYWQNPGDSGIPTSFDWTLPEGLSANAVQWPTPETLDVSGIINYGYSNHVTFPTTFNPAKDGVSGEVTLKANWLVCRDICIPESVTLSAPYAPNTAAASAYQAAAAALPKRADTTEGWQSSYHVEGETVKLFLSTPIGMPVPTKVDFFPIEDGVIVNRTRTDFTIDPATSNGIALTLPRGNGDLVETLHAVVQLHLPDGSRTAILMESRHNAADDIAAPPAPLAPAAAPPQSLFTTLALAFLGGLILNIMPCVLPILALKALAIAKKAHASRAAAAKQGLAYTAGVVGSFMAIAAIMLALKATGAAIGWGFQLQNAPFVALLAGVMLLVSANLLGLFTLPVLFGEKATGVDENSVRGSLLTGALAVLVATPCTAPFMATAIGATLSMPTLAALAVFAALGLGMASPFLLISLWPAARRLLPKPGAWMHRFKQLLAIPMLATAAWLIWVLVQLHSPNAPMKDAQHVPYAADTLAELRAAGTPVFVDATAAWCLTCKVNERLALNTPEMQEFLRSKNVVMMVADWTNSDPAITQYLASFGRNGVPIYVYYPPHGEPKLLPQILTPSIVREAITSNP